MGYSIIAAAIDPLDLPAAALNVILLQGLPAGGRHGRQVLGRLDDPVGWQSG